MLKQNIALLLDEECFWDVTLTGNDGCIVSTNKTILGSGSPVLKQMFFGEFRESASDKVSFDFSGRVLKAVVEYLHTDECDFDCFLKKADEEHEDAKARVLVEIMAAADYFEIPLLESMVNYHLSKFLISTCPTALCAALDEAVTRGYMEGSLWDVAEGLLHSSGSQVLIPSSDKQQAHCSGVKALKSGAFEKVCELISDKFHLVDVLTLWIGPWGDDDEEHDKLKPAQRTEIVTDLARNIQLEQFTIRQLSTMRPSALFPAERILDSLRAKTLEILDKGYFAAPDYIAVRGAGCSEVNGTYSRTDEMCHERYTYEKDGSWNGDFSRFCINAGTHADWFISFVPPGTLLGSSDIDFYATKRANHELVAPRTEWRIDDTQGVDPLPTIKYINRVRPLEDLYIVMGAGDWKANGLYRRDSTCSRRTYKKKRGEKDHGVEFCIKLAAADSMQYELVCQTTADGTVTTLCMFPKLIPATVLTPVSPKLTGGYVARFRNDHDIEEV